MEAEFANLNRVPTFHCFLQSSLTNEPLNLFIPIMHQTFRNIVQIVPTYFLIKYVCSLFHFYFNTGCRP